MMRKKNKMLLLTFAIKKNRNVNEIYWSDWLIFPDKFMHGGGRRCVFFTIQRRKFIEWTINNRFKMIIFSIWFFYAFAAHTVWPLHLEELKKTFFFSPNCWIGIYAVQHVSIWLKRVASYSIKNLLNFKLKSKVTQVLLSLMWYNYNLPKSDK